MQFSAVFTKNGSATLDFVCGNASGSEAVSATISVSGSGIDSISSSTGLGSSGIITGVIVEPN